MNQKLNIAFFLDNFYPQLNGVVTSSLNTVFELARRGHQIYGVVSEPPNHEPIPQDYFPFPLIKQKGYPAYFYPDFHFTYPFSSRIYQTILKFKPDVIHFHAPFTIGYQAIRIAHKLKVPVIGTFHTFFAEPEYLSLIGMEHNKFLNQFGWWYSNQFFNRCDAVISPGRATADILTDKQLKNKVKIISNGVDVEKYANVAYNPELIPIRIRDHEDWLLYIGRVSKEKKLNILLEALQLIIKKRPQTRLLIVGDGPYKNEMLKQAAEKGISGQIYFTGMVPNHILLGSGILKKMKLFVTTSTSENQPMTILESIMFGLPIIGVDAKGIPELVEGNGYIVEPNQPDVFAQKVCEVLNDPVKLKTLSETSKKLCHKYDIRYTTDLMETLYYDIIRIRKEHLAVQELIPVRGNKRSQITEPF